MSWQWLREGTTKFRRVWDVVYGEMMKILLIGNGGREDTYNLLVMERKVVMEMFYALRKLKICRIPQKINVVWMWLLIL